MKIVTLASPLPEHLPDLVNDGDFVQISGLLSEVEYKRLADVLKSVQDVELRVFEFVSGQVRDLRFLRYFPFIKRLSVDLFALEDLSGLDGVEDLSEFSFGATRKTFSLRFLKRFNTIRGLFLERHHKDFDCVSALTKLRALSLRSMTLPDLEILSAFPELIHFELKLGGAKNLRALAAAQKLLYLELWLIRKLDNVDVIAEITSLEALFLQALRHVRQLPSFAKLKSLRYVYLEQMKGLSDLESIAKAPALEDLTLVDMRQLPASSFTALARHPTLKHFSAGLGSTRLNAEATAVVNLPSSRKVWPHYSMRNAARQAGVYSSSASAD